MKNVRNEESFSKIDELFTKILIKARSTAEEPMQLLLCSQNKLEISNECSN